MRFAKRAISPTVDPIQNFPELTPTVTRWRPGTVRIGWTGGVGPRQRAARPSRCSAARPTATSTVLKSFQTKARTGGTVRRSGFVDTTAPPGSSQTYRIRVTDPFGNSARRSAGHRHHPGGHPARGVDRTPTSVLADNPAGSGAWARRAARRHTTGPARTTRSSNAANTRNIAGRVAQRDRHGDELPRHDEHGRGAGRHRRTGSPARRRSRSRRGCARRRPTAARSSASATATPAAAARTATTATST